MYPEAATMIQVIWRIRFGVVIVLVISAKIRMIFTKMLLNTCAEPPGQVENGIVASMIPPSAMTPTTSGVIRVIVCPAASRRDAIAASPPIAVSSDRCSTASPGI